MSSSAPSHKVVATLIPQSQTAVPAHQGSLTMSLQGSRVRFEIVLGRVQGTPAFKIQHSTLPGIWTDVKTAVDAVEELGDVCTFTAGSNLVTLTAHGYQGGEIVSFFATAGELPPEIVPHQPFKVSQVVDADNIIVSPYLSQGFMSTVPSIAGSGTYRLCPAQSVSVTVNPEVTADQAYIPLRPQVRWVATTDVAESAQILMCLTSFAP
jgi:hypothetical protein